MVTARQLDTFQQVLSSRKERRIECIVIRRISSLESLS